VIHLSERVVKKYSEIVQQDIPLTRMDLIDLLRIYPISQPSQFVPIVEALDPITPRLYSIASSPLAHQDEVHLTVAKNTFLLDEQKRNGLCSSYLSQLKEGDDFDFYIHKNQLFKMAPQDKDIIMIGPGTGIAPFRSFVAQRDAEGAEGRSWLFFGDQHFTTDFLYQAEWQNWLQVGALTRMNVAFSRDQDQKLYVQHKLLQHAGELFEWIEGGAYVYICGTKDPMSVDVENTLLQIITEYKQLDESQAMNYLFEMKENGRLLKDVY
jgi:sulfite reductase (NADPH) flavoprotein alpha-component